MSSGLQLALLVTLVQGPNTSSVSEAQIYKWAARSSGYALESQTLSLDTTQSLEGDLRRCKLELNCIAQRLKDQAHSALMIILHADESQTLTTQLLDIKTRKIVASQFSALSGTTEALLHKQIMRVLAKGGHPLGGGVRFPKSPAGARLKLENLPTPSGDITGRVLLPTGAYKGQLIHPDYESANVRFNIEQGLDINLDVTMTLVPPLYTRWWLWTGVGAVVAGASVGAYFLFRPTTINAIHQRPE